MRKKAEEIERKPMPQQLAQCLVSPRYRRRKKKDRREDKGLLQFLAALDIFHQDNFKEKDK